ncbi:uroporphyrinogen-III synthase [Persephonella hydrogeniphila]|uniref:Uroporphyrinogen-III synthase n=1 Tax=Persephonella hydrogeniphila TaxID=198703 RepID=A0A285N1L0_9AQUI|nr:uroporphyrinogen-III synthase [Persephonella hydrogeniphila]SNZ03354.1 uroporphyrinogen-III synthase [Persephonella hydrogeniphila]
MKKVLITRDPVQAKKTAEKLKEAGFEPVLFPTIRFEAVDFPVEKVLSADILIFSSQNAVRFLLKKIEPEKIKNKIVIATGEKTKKSLEKIGIEKVLIPQLYSGEGVASLLQRKANLHGKKIAIIRPVEGIDTAAKKLTDYFYVETVPVYKTVINIPENRNEVEKLLEEKKIFAVIFTSPSTFKNFTKIFKNWYKLLKGTKKAVIGSTTAKALLEENVHPDIIPEKFTIEEVIKKLRQLT